MRGRVIWAKNKVGLIELSDKRRSKFQLIRMISSLTGARCINTEGACSLTNIFLLWWRCSLPGCSLQSAPWCSKYQFTRGPRQSRRQILCLESHSSILQSQGSTFSFMSKNTNKTRVRGCRPFSSSIQELSRKKIN